MRAFTWDEICFCDFTEGSSDGSSGDLLESQGENRDDQDSKRGAEKPVGSVFEGQIQVHVSETL